MMKKLLSILMITAMLCGITACRQGTPETEPSFIIEPSVRIKDETITLPCTLRDLKHIITDGQILEYTRENIAITFALYDDKMIGLLYFENVSKNDDLSDKTIARIELFDGWDFHGISSGTSFEEIRNKFGEPTVGITYDSVTKTPFYMGYALGGGYKADLCGTNGAATEIRIGYLNLN